jgi:hypothetical protein
MSPRRAASAIPEWGVAMVGMRSSCSRRVGKSSELGLQHPVRRIARERSYIVPLVKGVRPSHQIEGMVGVMAA